MNEMSAKKSIDVCSSADWQSRGPTEILLKTFAIYFTTAVLLFQYGARSKMPLKERWWFVIRALLFPLWSATALLLNILTRMITSILEFNESARPLEAFCASIGMYATNQQIDALPATESRLDPNSSLRESVPLAEISDIVYLASSNESVPLRAHRSKTKKPWKSRCLSILVTFVYILQASATLLLMFRRSQFPKKEYTAHGERIDLYNDFYYWWDTDYLDGFAGGFKKNVAITPADSGATKLAMYGILIALCYIIVESTEMRWQYVDTNRPWMYQIEGSNWKAQRCCIGICVSYLIDYGLHRYVGTLSTYRQSWAMFAEIMKLSSNHLVIGTRNVPFIVLAVLVLIVLRNLKPLRLRIPIWFRSNLRTYVAPLHFPLTLFDSFDFKHQDPSHFRFIEDDFDTTSLKQDEQVALLDDARHRQTRYYLYVAPWAIPLIVFGILHLYEDIWTSRPGQYRWVFGDCVVRGDLSAWAWKDPLADMLWAF